MKTIRLIIILAVVFLARGSFADTETTADVTEKSAGATHVCGRNNAECTYDPRSNIYSENGSDDDVVYWDSHGGEWNITNNINAFMTEDQMLQGFTMDSSIGLRDRNYTGGDPFTVEIKVTDGTTTYSDTAEFTTSAGEAYQTITSQLVVPENTLAYSLATFGLILEGTSLTNGYNGPQTNAINLTSTYELINNVQDTVLDLVANAVDDIITDQGISAVDTAQMDISVTTPSGAQTISIGVSATPAAVTVSVPTVGGKIESIQIDTGMASADSQPEPVAEVAEAVAEVESAVEKQESSSEEKEETKETKADKAKAVQAIVTRVLQAVSMAGGDTDSTKLALMGILGTPGFSSYQQQEMPDVAFYDTTVAYESTTYIDPLSNVFNLGSDSMMNEMIDSQYK